MLVAQLRPPSLADPAARRGALYWQRPAFADWAAFARWEVDNGTLAGQASADGGWEAAPQAGSGAPDALRLGSLAPLRHWPLGRARALAWSLPLPALQAATAADPNTIVPVAVAALFGGRIVVRTVQPVDDRVDDRPAPAPPPACDPMVVWPPCDRPSPATEPGGGRGGRGLSAGSERSEGGAAAGDGRGKLATKGPLAAPQGCAAVGGPPGAMSVDGGAHVEPGCRMYLLRDTWFI